MRIDSHIGKSLPEPIQNTQYAGAALHALWDTPQKLRTKNVTATFTGGGGTLLHTYLIYVPGLVTYCTIGPNPVWTGYMSGCFLFRFRMGGKLIAAHVGTDSNSQANTDKVKAVWRTMMARPDVSEVYGFCPTADLPASTLTAAGATRRPVGFTGWWEGNGAMRIVTLLGFQNDALKKEIFAVDAAPLQPWAVLQNHPKFRVGP